MNLMEWAAKIDGKPVLKPVVVIEESPSAEFNGMFSDAATALKFMRAGKAVITLRSKKTGVRFTYRLNTNKDGNTIFVSLLSGPDNDANYKYLGRISRDYFYSGRRIPRPGDISADAPASKAFGWAWNRLVKGELPDALEIWHEGRCGRCARRLTVPESISSGFGPECIHKI